MSLKSEKFIYHCHLCGKAVGNSFPAIIILDTEQDTYKREYVEVSTKYNENEPVPLCFNCSGIVQNYIYKRTKNKILIKYKKEHPGQIYRMIYKKGKPKLGGK